MILTLDISENLELALFGRARTKGVTPAALAQQILESALATPPEPHEERTANTLSRVDSEIAPKKGSAGEPTVNEILEGLIGSFDSSQEDYCGRTVSPLAESVADKLQRQGIEAPWRRPR